MAPATAPLRCGLCSAPVDPGNSHCGECGLVWTGSAPPAHDDPRFAALAACRRLSFRNGHVGAEGLVLGLETLRTLASRFDRTATLGPLARRLLRRVPVRALRSAVTLADFEKARSVSPDVALGCIARAADLPALVGLVASHGAGFDAIAVMVDGAVEDADRVHAALAAVPRVPRLAIDAAPLAGDFGAQRNRVQRLARTRWILHLDTDEIPDVRLAANLAAIVADADRHADKVVGFARLNLVDGRPSAFYPDTQYRLVRSDVRFHRKVHESPLPGLDWRAVHRSLGGGLIHRLSSERVRARSLQYEAIAEGAGHPQDERLLLDDWPGIPADIIGAREPR